MIQFIFSTVYVVVTRITGVTYHMKYRCEGQSHKNCFLIKKQSWEHQKLIL